MFDAAKRRGATYVLATASLLLAGVPSRALALSVNGGGLRAALNRDKLVVHGVVQGVDHCLSNDGTQAHQFVRIQVASTLLGQWSPAQGDPQNVLRVHFFAGSYPDGSTSALANTPALVPGDEVVLALAYRDDGGPSPVPISQPDTELYRIIPLGGSPTAEHGTTAVVDGVGRLQIEAANQVVPGPLVHTAAASLPFEGPVDLQRAGADILSFASQVELPPPGEAFSGAWRGSAYLRMVDPETDEVLGCQASLTGSVDGVGIATLEGRCNVPYIGVATLTYSGAFSMGGWTGELTATPDDERIASRTVTLTHAVANPDFLLASGEHTETVAGVAYTVEAWVEGGFAGPRPLADRESFLSWLDGQIEESGAVGGTAISVKPGNGPCNQPLSIHSHN